MTTKTSPTGTPDTDDPLAQLSGVDKARIARITEAFMALSPAGREAVLLWLLPQQMKD